MCMCINFLHWSVTVQIACNTGILSGQVKVTSSQLFIWPTKFDLELEWMAGGGAWERLWYLSPHPYPLLPFDHHSALWYKFVCLPSLPPLFKLKMVAIIFTEKSKEYNGLHMFTNDIRKKTRNKCLSGCGYLVSTITLNSQKWLTCKSSLWYPHIIQQSRDENTQNYQVGRIYLELTPNSHNLVTRKSVAARGEN